MFEIYKKQFELNGTTYEVIPLSGKYLPKFYKLMGTLSSGVNMEEGSTVDKEKELAMVLEKLNEETIRDLHELVLEMFVSSYPNKSVDELDRFVSQNIMALMPHLVSVNTSTE